MTTETSPGVTSEEFDALDRMLARASGFWLAFAIADDATLRERMAKRAHTGRGPDSVIDVRLVPSATSDVVSQLEARLASSQPSAIFVFGLETMLDLSTGRSSAVELLNLNRDYLWKRFSCPLVFWTPFYAVKEVARLAPDLWSGRSDVFRFEATREDLLASLDQLELTFTWSTSHAEKLALRQLLNHVSAVAEQQVLPIPECSRLSRLLARAAQFDGLAGCSRQHWQAALDGSRVMGDRTGEAGAVKGLADLAIQVGSYDDAAERYLDAHSLFLLEGDTLGQADAILGLGTVLFLLGRYHNSEKTLRDALALVKDYTPANPRAKVLLRLADVQVELRQYERASRGYAAVVKEFAGTEWSREWAHAKLGQARLAARNGQTSRALEDARRAFDKCAEIGDHAGLASAHLGLADIQLSRAYSQDSIAQASDQDSIARASDHAERALVQYLKLQDPHGQAAANMSLAEIARARRDPATVEEGYGRAIGLYRAINHRRGEANALLRWADTDDWFGDYHGARQRYRDALAALVLIGDSESEAYVRQRLADLEFGNEEAR